MKAKMTRKELVEIFADIYNKMLPLGIAKSVTLNFRVPRNVQHAVFAYCLNDVFQGDVKGYQFCVEDDDYVSEISLNPKLTSMNLECIRNTIAHELIHTINGCEDHTAKFLRIGKKAKKLLNLQNDVLAEGTDAESEMLFNL